VEAGTGATAFAGGATAGGATTLAAEGPLFAAMGAVAQVPTQWSGGFGAACIAAVVRVKASRTRRLGRVVRRMGVGTGVGQPRKKSFSRTILRWFCCFPGKTALASPGGIHV
jgi:hypothetical protein